MWSSQATGVGHFAKYAEERINQSPLKEEVKKQNFVQIEPVRKKARRVYDAPDKGVLWGWEVSAYVLTKAVSAGAFFAMARADALREFA